MPDYVPVYNVNNVIVGLAQLYVAEFGLAVPGQGEPMPADSVALGAAWGGNWATMGATEEGVKYTINPKTNDIRIEEQPNPADVTVDSEDITIATTLLEDTLANMQIAYGTGTIVTQAAGPGVIGKSTLTLGTSLTYWSVGFEAVNREGFWRRAYFPKVVSAAQVDTSYRRAAAARMYPTTFRAVCPPGEIQVVDMTAVAT